MRVDGGLPSLSFVTIAGAALKFLQRV